jgi:hypothetical protein
MVLRRFLAAVTALAALGVASSLPACGDVDATSGKRVTLDLEIEGSSAARAPFTNAQGWTVTLSKALVATGAFTYYDGATLISRRPPAERLLEALFVRTAFAHPGHYAPGTAKGEMLTPSSADLLARARLGRGGGISGPVRSATFSFQAPAAGPFAAELGAAAVVLEGTAEKDRETRPFRAEIGPADVVASNGKTEVVGCPFEEADVEGDGVVTVTVKIEAWLDQVDFTDVPPLLADGSLARNQLVRGMRAALPYVFSYMPQR